LGFLKKRREKAFLKALPDAVDVIVRGIKAGLPLFESIKVVAADAPEPLKSEFLAIIETQAIGMPLGDACARLFERMPVPEANFFGIVIAIQQKSGGNLSEALSNLSKVLRDRKKMAEKIQAMSMEAKASAGIIGSLPPIVFQLLHQPVLDDRATASKAEFGTSPAFDGEAAELMWRHYLASDGSAAAVPARRSRFDGLPDTLITCAEIDPFRDEAIDYAQRLLRAGVGTELHVFARACHGFDSLLPDWSASQRLFELQGDALRRVWDGA